MDASKDTNILEPDDNHDETTYHSYILRIWKIGKDTFKGYILDPVTDQTYPLVNISQEDAVDESIITTVGKGAIIKSIGCWMGLWKSESGDENLE